MSKDLKPQSPIAIRFQHDLKINGKGIRTQQSYVRMLRKFTEFLGDEPDAACEEDLRRYFLHISENQLWKPSTVNVAYQALKQFFRLTVSMRPVQAKRSLNRFDQPSASPQSIEPSSTSTVSLSTSTSTTKSDAMHEQPRSPMSRQVKVTVRKRPIRDVGASLGSPFRELYPIDTPTGPETLGTACVLEKSIASGLK